MKAVWRTAIVAAGGGGLSALVAALLDPDGFSIKYHLGEGRLTIMVLQGAAAAVAALFIPSPRRK